MDSKVINKKKVKNTIEIKGAEMHNLKSIDISHEAAPDKGDD